MKFKANKYADILWMDDFDTNSSEAIDIEAGEEEDYVSEDDAARLFPDIDRYRFRLHPYKYLKQTLDELNANFFQYSCAVLDINMKEGFSFQDKEEETEYKDIEAILNEANVWIRDEHRWPNGYEEFKKNAGYYIFLYLLQRGMPSNRIVIFTGNKGEKENSSAQTANLTEKWEENFKAAGLVPPLSFDKKTGKEELAKWLEKTLDNRYRLRSCMVIMSSYVLDALGKCDEKVQIKYDAFKNSKERKWDKSKNNDYQAEYDNRLENDILTGFKEFREQAKLVLQDMQSIHLRLPETELETCSFFKSLIEKIAHPWEAKELLSMRNKYPDACWYAYWTTMCTTRNWLAHNVIPSFEHLATEAFLFGIAMCGMFNLREFLGSDKEEYEMWEDELLTIIKESSNNSGVFTKPSFDELGKLVLRSCYEFHIRETESKYKTSKLRDGDFTRDVCHLIHDLGQKKNGYPRYEVDLLRDFLHGIAFLYFEEARENMQPTPKNGRTNIEGGSLWFTVNLDYKCKNAYQVYLHNDEYNRFQKLDGTESKVNTNREWDYIVAIFGHVKRELDRLYKLDSKYQHMLE